MAYTARGGDRRSALIGACAALVFVLPPALGAQTRVFVSRLGTDTVAIERVAQHGRTIEGVLVRHLGATSMLKYSITLNKDGTVARYEQGTFHGDGTPAPPNPRTGAAAVGLTMTFTGDTVVRDVPVNGRPALRRTVVPHGTLPAMGDSWLGNEMAVDAARKAKDGRANVIGFAPNATAATSPDIRIMTRDSAEIVTQGFRVGVKTDRHGRLVHGDGSLTTHKIDVTVTKDVDVAALARTWAAQDAGRPAAAVNTPDSVVATIGGAHLVILYSRPARRGRELWGKLVPFDTTWRMGADFATQLHTDKALDIGGTKVAAGTYTLWLLPSQGPSYLLVNTKTKDPRDATRRLWGTEWDPAYDIAKIPLQKQLNLPTEEERFHMFIADGMLMMHWGNSGYGVSIKAYGP